MGIEGCEKVPVEGELEAKPTARDTEAPSGLTVHVEVPNEGLTEPDGIASSDLKKVKVALPQGVTINPSQAEGLGVCSPAQYESTELSFHPTSKGCPEDSKIGKVEVKTPLLHETIPGDVYIAQQDDPTTSAKGAENPFDSLLAIYIVLAEPQRGILVKLPGRVDLEDPAHPGQIVTTFDDLPQLPFSTFDFKFREGARAPLVTPPTCGTYTTETEITGHSDPDNPITSRSSFAIDRGIGGGPCPPGGILPFNPGFSAGAINPNAGSYSPFYMRLTRNDGEQDLTSSPRSGPRRLGQDRRGSQMPRGADRRRQGQDRPLRAGGPQLPTGLPDRKVPGRSGSRLGPHLRRRQDLPRRPLERRAPLRRRDHPCRGRAIRCGDGGRQGGLDA